MSKLPLSVVILTHRADERLVKCLKSVDFADEILVLDDNSHFNWSKYPHVKVHKIACPIDDFGTVRNQGLKLAKNEWVFFLDSDEYLDGHAESHFAKAIAQEELDGFWLRRIDIYAKHTMSHGEVGHVYFLRLMRKKVAQFERTVHEFGVVAGDTENMEAIIRHEPHLNVTEFFEKITRYAYLEAQSRPKYSKGKWWFEVIFYPPGKFLYNYLLKLGFLDGWPGFVYAYCMSFHSLLVRIYLYDRFQAK